MLKKDVKAEKFALFVRDTGEEIADVPDAPPARLVPNDRPLRRMYYVLTVIWIVCLIYASVFFLTGQPIWEINVQASQFRASAPSVIFDRIRSGYLMSGGRLFRLSFQQAIDLVTRSVNTVNGYGKNMNVPWYIILSQTADGLILLLSILWTLRLFLRTVLGIRNEVVFEAKVEETVSCRKRRSFRSTCLLLGGEAFVLDLLSLMLRRYSVIMMMLSFQRIALAALLAILVVQILFKSRRKRSVGLETDVAQCLLALLILGMAASMLIM